MLSTLITSNSFVNNFLAFGANVRFFKKRFFDLFHKLWHQFFEFFLNISFCNSADLTGVKLRMIRNKEIGFILWFFLFNDLRLIILFFKRLVTFWNRLDVIFYFNFSLFWAVFKQRFTGLNRFRFFLWLKPQFLNLLFERLNSHFIIKNNFLSLIIEALIDLVNINFDCLLRNLKHGF